MSELETDVAPAPDPFPKGTVDAGVYASRPDGFAHSVVVLAMGESCWLIRVGEGWHLRVKASVGDSVRYQLACYDRESVGWPPRLAVDPAAMSRRRLPLSPLFWAFGVVGVFWAQGRWPGLTDVGLLDAERVFGHGEWWRAATALWLHGDAGHLVSNLGSGLWVFFAVMLTFGVRAGWAWLTVAAVAGNLAAVLLHHADDYRSLGASTAIFAGLGLLAGRAVQVMSRSDHPQRWRATLVPLASGVVVLGLFGAGGLNIDVLAHGTGFGAGLLTGFVASAARATRDELNRSEA